MSAQVAAPPDEVLEFLELVRGGSGEVNAAYSVNWSPAKLRKMMRDGDFAELVQESKLRLVESLEETVVKRAMAGNVRCLELYLFTQAAERGWRPPTQRVDVRKEITAKVEVVAAVKAGLLQALKEEGGVEALQQGGRLDRAIEATTSGDH